MADEGRESQNVAIIVGVIVGVVAAGALVVLALGWYWMSRPITVSSTPPLPPYVPEVRPLEEGYGRGFYGTVVTTYPASAPATAPATEPAEDAADGEAPAGLQGENHDRGPDTDTPH